MEGLDDWMFGGLDACFTCSAWLDLLVTSCGCLAICVYFLVLVSWGNLIWIPGETYVKNDYDD